VRKTRLRSLRLKPGSEKRLSDTVGIDLPRRPCALDVASLASRAARSIQRGRRAPQSTRTRHLAAEQGTEHGGANGNRSLRFAGRILCSLDINFGLGAAKAIFDGFQFRGV
jgi:hypothetical protein